MARQKNSNSSNGSTAKLGFEAKLWLTADQLFCSIKFPLCLRFCRKNDTLDSANDAHLFGGEFELSSVA